MSILAAISGSSAASCGAGPRWPWRNWFVPKDFVPTVLSTASVRANTVNEVRPLGTGRVPLSQRGWSIEEGQVRNRWTSAPHGE